MNLTATTADPTLNPLPPSPPLALLASSSSSTVRIVIPSNLDNNIQSKTLLQQQIPSLVTPPTTTAAPIATDMSVANTLMVSNPLAPQLAVDSNTTPNNDNDDDDDDDAFMMDIEIPHILDDDEDVEANGHPPSSVPLVDADNDDHGDTLDDAPRYTTTETPLTTTAAVPARGLAHPNVAAVGGAAVTDKEKIGRWTEQEHLVFLEGLRTHGKQWKVIATMIGTRTVVQVRTHAQKYFQKLDRNSGGAGASSSSCSSSSKCSSSHNKVASSKVSVVSATAADSALSLSDPQPEQRHGATLLSPNSTILPQQRPTYTKRKSLPSSLPSRGPKKSRTGSSSHKMNPRLSMGHRGTSTSTTATTTQAMVPPPSTLLGATNSNELPSYPSYISKSSSSTGSDENWSTISPDNVIWDRVDFGNYSEYANIISEDNSNSVLGVYNNTADDVSHHPSDNHNCTSSAYDLLGDDPLEWLIETDCTQQYLPESSLPLFPFHAISSDYCHDPHLDDKLEASNDDNEILLRMTDPNVTVQSLFLPTTSSASDDDMAVLEQ